MKNKCKFCNREFKNPGGLAQHEYFCKDNPDYKNNYTEWRKIPRKKRVDHPGGANKGKVMIHKGNTNKYVIRNEIKNYLELGWDLGASDLVREQITKNNKTRFRAGQANTEEAEIIRRKRISNTMKNNPKAGGLREGSGRGRKGWYKGIFCDSSWELAFVIYCIEHSIPIKRCDVIKTYIYNGIQHKYIPDFIINNNEIIEIKGFTTEQWFAKLKQNPDIKPLYKNDIEPYINYVVKKYGKNYTELYDNKLK